MASLDQKLAQLVPGKKYYVKLKLRIVLANSEGREVIGTFVEKVQKIPVYPFDHDPPYYAYVFDIDEGVRGSWRFPISENLIYDVMNYPVDIKELPQDVSRKISSYLDYGGRRKKSRTSRRSRSSRRSLKRSRSLRKTRSRSSRRSRH
jgi:hypothetical protein